MATNSDRRMFKTNPVPLDTTVKPQQLVLDYLAGKKDLSSCYSFTPDLEGFRKAIQTESYASLDRKALASVLKKQAELVSNTTPASISNIESLENKKAYTIVTGHQLCLFTGPLYFIYKILSVVRLCKRLSKEFPDHRFVPVYWMASEDHDFAEVNHFHLFGKKLEWSTTEQGAVGDFSTENLRSVYDELAAIAGDSPQAAQLLELFKSAYLEHRCLADATRFLVNALFGVYGVVTVDGNDVHLKKQFTKEFAADILDQITHREIESTVAELAGKGYAAQVTPREVNVFYMEPGLRARIDRRGTRYELHGSGKQFTRDEMTALIVDAPEKLSPNVSLRPIYQQKILPNLCYVGGPGEIAYWLEYRRAFEAMNVFYPVLMLRDTFTVIDKNMLGKLNKLGFSPQDVFSATESLISKLLASEHGEFSLDSERKQLTDLFNAMSGRAESVDATLKGTVAAELQKTLKSLDTVEAKARRALKAKSESGISQISAIRAKLFPQETPQERYDNFSAFFLRHGPGFFEGIFEVTDPFDTRHKVLLEN